MMCFFFASPQLYKTFLLYNYIFAFFIPLLYWQRQYQPQRFPAD